MIAATKINVRDLERGFLIVRVARFFGEDSEDNVAPRMGMMIGRDFSRESITVQWMDNGEREEIGDMVLEYDYECIPTLAIEANYR